MMRIPTSAGVSELSKMHITGIVHIQCRTQTLYTISESTKYHKNDVNYILFFSGGDV